MSRLARHLAGALDPVELARIGLGLECDEWQARLLRPPHHPRELVVASRQVGKSCMASLACMSLAIYQPGSLILLCSPSLRQSQELLYTMQSLYRALGKPIAPANDNALSLVLENHSRVIALPGDNPDALRGYSKVDLICADEASRIDDSMMAALRPMLAVSSGRLLLLSSPNGRRGFFWEYSQSNEFRVTTITADMCPRISPEFLEAERKALGERVFLQEYMASWSESSDSWLSGEKVDRMFARSAFDGRTERLDDVVVPLPVRLSAPPARHRPAYCPQSRDGLGHHSYRDGWCMTCQHQMEA